MATQVVLHSSSSSLIPGQVRRKRSNNISRSSAAPSCRSLRGRDGDNDNIMSCTPFSSRSSSRATSPLIMIPVSALVFATLFLVSHAYTYDTDLSSPIRVRDLKLLEDLIHEDSIHMHSQGSLQPGLRSKRDTLEDEMAKLKKTSTKKPTQLIKQKPTQQLFKSSTVTSSSLMPTSAEAARNENNDSGHSSSLSVSSASASTFPSSSLAASSSSLPSSSSSSSSSAEGNPFFAPEDVTLPPNSNSTEDHHQYYNSTFIADAHEVDKYWIEGEDLTTSHEMLSNSHRRAATVQLKFAFPFYGHPIRNVTIATGGFLYLGETVHSWLAATQYIAPLMANFDTSISNYSSIKYVNNDTHFVVQWKNAELQDQTPPGNFSFQVTLKNTGDIIFVYKSIPFPIADIPDSKHPVKVGISDAYVIDRTVFFIRRKTIYEYHRADLKKENISNKTAIYFTALPTCVALTDCESCVTASIAFECRWCDSVQRCSDGFDRHRQDWLLKKCDSESHSKDTPNRCKPPPPTTAPPPGLRPASSSSSSKQREQSSDYNYNRGAEVHSGKIGAMFFLILIAFVAGIGLWVFYAYKNPQTGAGQFLIKYRPAEWRWSQPGDTRYTAASIHM